MVELKVSRSSYACSSMQLLSYLKATDHRLGLLINFNVKLLKNGIKRVFLISLLSAAVSHPLNALN